MGQGAHLLGLGGHGVGALRFLHWDWRSGEILNEIADNGRQAAHDSAEISRDVWHARSNTAQDIHRHAVEDLQAHARSDAMTQAGFTANADRVAESSRDVIREVNNEHSLELRALSDIRYERAKNVTDMGAELAKLVTALELRTQQQIADSRLQSSREHCEIKELVLTESARGRDQVADYRMRDLEADLAHAKVQLLKP